MEKMAVKRCTQENHKRTVKIHFHFTFSCSMGPFRGLHHCFQIYRLITSSSSGPDSDHGRTWVTSLTFIQDSSKWKHVLLVWNIKNSLSTISLDNLKHRYLFLKHLNNNISWYIKWTGTANILQRMSELGSHAAIFKSILIIGWDLSQDYWFHEGWKYLTHFNRSKNYV